MRYRIFSVAVTAAAATIMLAGCSISLTPQILEVSGSDVAVTRRRQDSRPRSGRAREVDCGTDSVKLEVGTSLTCVLTDPGTDLEYDVVVTFTEVTGRRLLRSTSRSPIRRTIRRSPRSIRRRRP